MKDPHIGPEHAHALIAIHDRARRVIAERGFTEPARSPHPRAPIAASASVQAREVTVGTYEMPAPQPTIALQLSSPTEVSGPTPVTEPEEDWEFLDGRWTSDGW